MTFDDFARDYDIALQQGLAVSGESRDYFAQGRVDHIRDRLDERAHLADMQRVMDFGCGTGTTIPLLAEAFRPSRLLGVDTSEESLRVASSAPHPDCATYSTLEQHRPDASFDLVYCNGVFHHIPLDERGAAVKYVSRSLKPGGYFAFFENNPWNPGTRYIMSRIPFDRDAVTLSHRTASALLSAGKFEIVRVDFLFFFPRWLAALRGCERGMHSVPLGAQYLVLCRRPQA